MSAASSARYQLQTLGQLKLVDRNGGDDASLASRPRKLAVLAWLALRPARRASRDQLIAMFWGERDDERARNSLSDALSHIRRILGRNAIRSVADDVLLADDAPLLVDAVELASASAAKNHARVVELYTGAFLDGVYIDDAPDFDDWRDRERTRYAAHFAHSAAERCAVLAQASEWSDCYGLAERWLEAEPASAKAAVFVLNAIRAPATHESRAAALAAYGALVHRLDEQFGVPPHDSVALLAREIRAQMLAEAAAHEATIPMSTQLTIGSSASVMQGTVSVIPAPQANTSSLIDQPAPVISARVMESSQIRRWWSSAVYTAGSLIVGALAFIAWRAQTPDLDSHRIVIAEFENRTGDSTLSMLGRIVADAISRDLTTNRIVEVVDPAGVLYGRTIDARTIGRYAGAGIVVLGSYSAEGDSVSLEARIVSTRDGRVLQAVNPAMASRGNLNPALQLICERVAGAVASELDIVINTLAREASQPTTYEVYRTYVEALDLFSHKQYKASIPAFQRAAALDTTFVLAKIWLIAAYGNASDMRRADSLAQAVDASAQHLLPLDRALLDYWLANNQGNRNAQYQAGLRALLAAPNSELTLYMAGFAAINVNRSREAVQLLQRIRVENSRVSWNTYGTRLSFALHMAGRFDDELAEARRRRAQVPMLVQAIAE
ncbi:MAG: BTAD domain-containing putative transcriptional regulator, partial [Gemmatimonadaceae bacterium]